MLQGQAGKLRYSQGESPAGSPGTGGGSISQSLISSQRRFTKSLEQERRLSSPGRPSFGTPSVQRQADLPTSARAAADAELDGRSKKIMNGFASNMHVLCNEPTLGLYRIQEHTRKKIPSVVQKKNELLEVNKSIRGMSYDIDYATSVIHKMRQIDHFSKIQRMLQVAITRKEILNGHLEDARNAAPLPAEKII